MASAVQSLCFQGELPAKPSQKRSGLAQPDGIQGKLQSAFLNS